MTGATATCPICKKPLPADRVPGPFCSARCRQIDLGRWLDGDYRIAGEPAHPEQLTPGKGEGEPS
jgi:uncharacterized protein